MRNKVKTKNIDIRVIKWKSVWNERERERERGET